MPKNTIDTIWVREQLESADVPESVSKALFPLLETWQELDIQRKDFPKIIEALGELVLGHALLPEESTEAWVEVVMGFIHTGDVVRVRSDAFEDAAGQYHNGRIGKVTAVRHGDIIFRSTDDKTPKLEGTRYQARHLERRVAQ